MNKNNRVYHSMLMLTLSFLFLVLSSLHGNALSCNQLDRDSLLSFYNHISSPSLNWSQSTDCCQWEGIACRSHDEIGRVTHLWLPEKDLSGTIDPFLANLSFLAHLNLSHNHFSGPFPLPLFRSLDHLQTLDLSFNLLSGLLRPESFPTSIRSLDLSSNRFNGSIDRSFLHQALNLFSFNISNNSFTGPIPSSICKGSPFLKILDFSMNQFKGHILPGIGECFNLEVFRAGSNSLSGWLPYDLYSVRTLKEISLPDNKFSGPIDNSIVMLSNLTILKLHMNELSGELPPSIGLLSALEQLHLYANSLNGTLPPSLMDCSKLTTLLLRNNHFGGEISVLDFSKLQQLQAIDLGNNSFIGKIPDSLCLCRSLTAVRLAYNQLVGETPPCMASLTSLTHLSLSDNYLSNVVGALKIFKHSNNLAVLFLRSSFHDEMMPDDNDLLHPSGLQNLQVLSLGGCNLKGQIPSWIAKLKKLKVLDLPDNRLSGPVPTWLGAMPSLFVLRLNHNCLSGDLPREIGQMPALIADKTSSNLSYLPLPFVFSGVQYNGLLNIRRQLNFSNNSLSGNIPAEIGRLQLLQKLEINNNNFSGSIPSELSDLTNLEILDISGNRLSGKIPESLTKLHFLSWFSVAENDLEGEIPSGGQFETFSAASFEGNPKLCGSMLKRNCPIVTQVETTPAEEEPGGISWHNLPLPFGLGYFVGLVAVAITLLVKSFY